MKQKVIMKKWIFIALSFLLVGCQSLPAQQVNSTSILGIELGQAFDKIAVCTENDVVCFPQNNKAINDEGNLFYLYVHPLNHDLGFVILSAAVGTGDDNRIQTLSISPLPEQKNEVLAYLTSRFGEPSKIEVEKYTPGEIEYFWLNREDQPIYVSYTNKTAANQFHYYDHIYFSISSSEAKQKDTKPQKVYEVRQ